MESVLSIELEVPSLRILNESQISEAEWLADRYSELALLDEKRLQALYQTQGYQRRLARAFNKKVKNRNIKEGDLVLKEIRAPIFDPRGKFKPNWTSPYIIMTIMPGEGIKLMDCHAPGFWTRLVRGLGELIRFRLLNGFKKWFIRKSY